MKQKHWMDTIIHTLQGIYGPDVYILIRAKGPEIVVISAAQTQDSMNFVLEHRPE